MRSALRRTQIRGDTDNHPAQAPKVDTRREVVVVGEAVEGVA